jgi:hypothetical protein
MERARYALTGYAPGLTPQGTDYGVAARTPSRAQVSEMKKLFVLGTGSRARA